MPDRASAAPGGDVADERTEVHVTGSEVVFRGRVWDIRQDRIDYDGSEIVREYTDHTGAVAVLALDADERVLVIQQYRHPVRMRDWEIPAGLLDVPGEDPLAAAKRELAEEADLEARTWHVLSDFFTSPGGSDESIRLYLARDVTAIEAFERVEEEADIVARWVPLDDVVDAVLARRVHNPSLITGALTAHVARGRGWSTLSAADAPWPTRSSGPRAQDPDHR